MFTNVTQLSRPNDQNDVVDMASVGKKQRRLVAAAKNIIHSLTHSFICCYALTCVAGLEHKNKQKNAWCM